MPKARSCRGMPRRSPVLLATHAFLIERHGGLLAEAADSLTSTCCSRRPRNCRTTRQGLAATRDSRCAKTVRKRRTGSRLVAATRTRLQAGARATPSPASVDISYLCW